MTPRTSVNNRLHPCPVRSSGFEASDAYCGIFLSGSPSNGTPSRETLPLLTSPYVDSDQRRPTQHLKLMLVASRVWSLFSALACSKVTRRTAHRQKNSPAKETFQCVRSRELETSQPPVKRQISKNYENKWWIGDIIAA